MSNKVLIENLTPSQIVEELNKYIIGQPWLVYFSWDSEKKEVRWNRVGRFVDDIQINEPTE